MKTLENMTLQRRTLLGSVISTAVLAACGGGGGAGGDAAPAPGDGGGQLPPGTPLPVSKTWQGAQLLELTAGDASEAHVAINAAGVGYAVWRQKDGTRDLIFASRYINGAWEKPEQINKLLNIVGEHRDPQVVVHSNGDALAVWVISDNKDFIAFNYAKNGVWASTPSDAAEMGESGIRGELSLASDGSGKALVVWGLEKIVSSVKTTSIESIEFNGGAVVSGSRGSLATSSSDLTAVAFPRVAMGSDGDAVAAWVQRSLATGQDTIVSLSYFEGQWRIGDEINSINLDGIASSPSVAVGANGKAIVAWEQQAGANTRLFANLASDFKTRQWGKAEQLSLDVQGATNNPQVTLDPLGNATVVWEQGPASVTGARVNIWANRFKGSAWLGAQKLEKDDAGDAFGGRIASDSAGNAIVVWMQRDGVAVSARTDIFASRLDAATPTQWSVPELIEKDDAGDALRPRIAMNPSGRALAVWLNDDAPVVGQLPLTSIKANVFK
jgi:hypothetical protein